MSNDAAMPPTQKEQEGWLKRWRGMASREHISQLRSLTLGTNALVDPRFSIPRNPQTALPFGTTKSAQRFRFSRSFLAATSCGQADGIKTGKNCEVRKVFSW